MACFLVPAAEAVVTTVVQKAIEKKAKAEEENGKKEENTSEFTSVSKFSAFSKKLKWLNSLLWGGTALLAFEHVWHGEVVPWFPFLTAAANADDRAEMLHEMATVGVTMAVLVTVVWIGMLIVSNMIEKRAQIGQTVKE